MVAVSTICGPYPGCFLGLKPTARRFLLRDDGLVSLRQARNPELIEHQTRGQVVQGVADVSVQGDEQDPFARVRFEEFLKMGQIKECHRYAVSAESPGTA